MDFVELGMNNVQALRQRNIPLRRHFPAPPGVADAETRTVAAKLADRHPDQFARTALDPGGLLDSNGPDPRGRRKSGGGCRQEG